MNQSSPEGEEDERSHVVFCLLPWWWSWPKCANRSGEMRWEEKKLCRGLLIENFLVPQLQQNLFSCPSSSCSWEQIGTGSMRMWRRFPWGSVTRELIVWEIVQRDKISLWQAIPFLNLETSNARRGDPLYNSKKPRAELSICLLVYGEMVV